MSFFKKQRKNSVNFSSFEQDDHNKEENKDLLKTSLQGNIQHVKQQLGNSGDIVIREIQIGK